MVYMIGFSIRSFAHPQGGAVVVFVCGQWQVLPDIRRPERVLLEGATAWAEVLCLCLVPSIYVYVSIYRGMSRGYELFLYDWF